MFFRLLCLVGGFEAVTTQVKTKTELVNAVNSANTKDIIQLCQGLTYILDNTPNAGGLLIKKGITLTSTKCPNLGVAGTKPILTCAQTFSTNAKDPKVTSKKTYSNVAQNSFTNVWDSNGFRYVNARYPNIANHWKRYGTSFNEFKYMWQKNDAKWSSSPPDGIWTFNRADLPVTIGSNALAGAIVTMRRNDWSYTSWKITTSYDSGSGTISIEGGPKSWDFDYSSYMVTGAYKFNYLNLDRPKPGFYLEGLSQFFDTSGEYFYNFGTKQLSIMVMGAPKVDNIWVLFGNMLNFNDYKYPQNFVNPKDCNRPYKSDDVMKANVNDNWHYFVKHLGYVIDIATNEAVTISNVAIKYGYVGIRSAYVGNSGLTVTDVEISSMLNMGAFIEGTNSKWTRVTINNCDNLGIWFNPIYDVHPWSRPFFPPGEYVDNSKMNQKLISDGSSGANAIGTCAAIPGTYSNQKIQALTFYSATTSRLASHTVTGSTFSHIGDSLGPNNGPAAIQGHFSLVEKSSFYNMGYAAIKPRFRATIDSNKFYNTMTSFLDGGSIYCWGQQHICAYITISNNVFGLNNQNIPLGGPQGNDYSVGPSGSRRANPNLAEMYADNQAGYWTMTSNTYTSGAVPMGDVTGVTGTKVNRYWSYLHEAYRNTMTGSNPNNLASQFASDGKCGWDNGVIYWYGEKNIGSTCSSGSPYNKVIYTEFSDYPFSYI